jgi:uncharacterized membrane protein
VPKTCNLLAIHISLSKSLSMTPFARKILYAVSFETGGILVAGLSLRLMSSADAAHTFSLAAFAATLALIWSYGFNTLFEAWESRQAIRGRGKGRRAAHAVLFEVGFTILLVPLTAWWLSVSLWTALWLEAAVVVIFVGYTYAFTWAFDRLFGLPASAR